MRNVLVACCFLLSNVTVVRSQDPKQTAGADELLQGLLELAPDPARQTGAPLQPIQDKPLKPTDVGLTEADLLGAEKSPLESIRQSMLISAGLLRRGINDDLLTLQDDILNRLDDLIGKLESESQSNGSSQQEESNTSSDEKGAGEQSKQRRKEGTSQTDTPQQATVGSRDSKQQTQSDDSTKPLSGTPSNVGPKRAVEVKLNAREAYQRKVWGQLPQRVRASMQSKMVEEFLPSHREQIETYYRRLMQRYRENDGQL